MGTAQRLDLLPLAEAGPLSGIQATLANKPRLTPNSTPSGTLPAVDFNVGTNLVLKRCRKGCRQWTILADKIDAVEEASAPEFGRRPLPLIAWRNYSHVRAGEIERARDECLSADNADPKLVQAEYRAEKKRYRDILRAGEEWDRRAGLTTLRTEYEKTSGTHARHDWAWEGAAQKRQRCLAIIDLLQARIRFFKELSQDWKVAAFTNASRFLTRMTV